jgi:hypothetical protein
MIDLKMIFDPDRAPAARIPLAGTTPADLPPEWLLAWDERAAIMEYDGKLPREWAEALALAEIKQQMRQAQPITPCCCRACMNMNNYACSEPK